MWPEPPPDVEACLDSVTCILGTLLTAVLPALVLVIAILCIVGVKTPQIAIFTQFISKYYAVHLSQALILL